MTLTGTVTLNEILHLTVDIKVTEIVTAVLSITAKVTVTSIKTVMIPVTVIETVIPPRMRQKLKYKKTQIYS